MTKLIIETENYFGQQRVETIEITNRWEAQRALAHIASLIPAALKETGTQVVREATGDSKLAVNLPTRLVAIKSAKEKSEDDGGSGEWWLSSNLYLAEQTDRDPGGLVAIEASGTWRNYGSPSGTCYSMTAAKLVPLHITPERWTLTLAAVRDKLARYKETHAKMHADARRLLAALESEEST